MVRGFFVGKRRAPKTAPCKDATPKPCYAVQSNKNSEQTRTATDDQNLLEQDLRFRLRVDAMPGYGAALAETVRRYVRP